MNDETLLHIIYLESRMLLSKKQYSDWRQIQDEFTDYKASLDPWSATEVLDFLYEEYLSDCPFTRKQIKRFLLSNDEILVYHVSVDGYLQENGLTEYGLG